jgi:hypothetical protein
MTIIEYAYYNVYRLLRMIRRSGVNEFTLACELVSLLLSTNLLTLVMLFMRIATIRIMWSNYIAEFTVICVFVIVYMLCKRYFITQGHAFQVVKQLETRSNPSKYPAIVGFLYMLGSIIGYWAAAQ